MAGGYYGETDAFAGDTGTDTGSVLNNLIRTAGALGTVALLDYAPKNAGQATTPVGSGSSMIIPSMSGSSISVTSIAVLAAIAVVAVYAFKKL